MAMGWVRPIDAVFIIASNSLASSENAGNDEDDDDDDCTSLLSVGWVAKYGATMAAASAWFKAKAVVTVERKENKIVQNRGLVTEVTFILRW